MATPRVTIDALPEQATVEDTNLIVVQDADTTKKMTLATLKTMSSTALDAHLADTGDAHDASAISATPSGAGVDSTTVQGQLGQLATATGSSTSGLADHLADTTAHTAAAIPALPHGEFAATDVQGQLEEIAAAIVTEFDFATESETVAGVLDDRAVTPAGLKAKLPAVDVREYGAVGDGVADDTAAIQAAIDYCLGGTPAAGAATARSAVAALYFPKGRYLTTTAPRVISVLGFEMFGDGYTSEIHVSGSRMYGVEFNGISRSHIHDLTITTAGTSDVRDAVAVNWDPAISARSTNFNVLERLYIGGKYVTGMAIGHDSGNFEVAMISIIDCQVNGQWTRTSGETTWWQNGFEAGSGPSANPLNYNFVNCDSWSNRYGLWTRGVNTTWTGGSMAVAEADFRHNGVRYLTVDGVRSEGSQRVLLVDDGGTTYACVSISNYLYHAAGLHADGRFISLARSGAFTLTNVEVLSPAVSPRIYFNHGGTPIRSAQMTLIGMLCPETLDNLFQSAAPQSQASIVAINYSQTTAFQQVLARTPFWVKGLQGATTALIEDLEIDGALDHDGTTVGFYGTTPVTKPTGVTAASALTTLGLATATEGASAWSTYAPALYGKTGEYWGSPLTRTTTAMVAGNIYSHPVYVPFACTIVRIGAEITTLAASSTLSLGIYEDDGFGDPGVRLLDAGTVDGSTTGNKEITISQALTAGRVYHLVALCQGGTPTVRTINTGWSGRNNTVGNASNGLTRAGRANSGVVGTALPTPFPAVHSPFNTVPVVTLRF